MSYHLKSLGQDTDDAGHKVRVRQNLVATAVVGVLGLGLFWWIGRETTAARRAGRGRYG